MNDIAFIGVGTMATPMAWRFLDRGWRVCLTDPVPDRTTPFESHRFATVYEDVESLPKATSFVVLSLPSASVLDTVVQALAATPAVDRPVVINTSTVGLSAARRAAEVVSAAGYRFVDAPVSGGAAGAEHGRLTVIASGDPESVDRCAEVFAVIGEQVFTVGTEPGQAQAMKVANNVLSLGALAATAEATVITRKAGIPLDVALDVLNASSGRNSATAVKFPRHILSARYDFGFPTAGALKDVSLYTELAHELGAVAPLGDAVQDCWQHAVAAGYGEDDCTHIVTVYERAAQLSPEAQG